MQENKKAGIITHHDVHNHGAHLQLYALCQVLKKLGYNASALRYTKNYDFLEQGISKKYDISFRSLPMYFKYLLQKGVSKTYFNVKKRSCLKSFRHNNSLVGEYYSYSKDLDAVIIGSDEIFSIEPGLNPWFWGMGVPCDKIISYAASFGPTTKDFISEKKAEEFIRAGISRISAISVRDKNSKDIIKSISDSNATIVCDPVILYGYASEISESKAKKVSNNKYILIYSYDNTLNDEDSVTKIRSYANKNGLSVYSVGFYHKWCDKNINVDPLDIFSWFVNAELIVTDTFHGAVLSIVTNMPMVVKLKNNQNKLLWLLKEYGLEERIVKDFSETSDVASKTIDFEKVNKSVEENRLTSMNFLKDALK